MTLQSVIDGSENKKEYRKESGEFVVHNGRIGYLGDRFGRVKEWYVNVAIYEVSPIWKKFEIKD